MTLLTDPQAWVALATLTFLEIVLGIDNVIFIAILASKLPESEQKKARTVGLLLAMLVRIGLLFSLSWLMKLTGTLFTVLENDISGRDLILIAGGMFLLGKSTVEIHGKLEGEEGEGGKKGSATFGMILLQIVLLDIVFSLDSVITAIGMVDQIWVMVTAIVIAVGTMIAFMESISDFVERRPTVKMLALSFLLLIGVALVADGLDFHIPKGYIYFSMGFAVFVEMLNLKIRKVSGTPVKLRRKIRR